MIARHSFDERISRARALAAEEPVAAELLLFYAAVVEYQSRLAGAVQSAPTAGDFARTVDADAAARAVPSFLKWLKTYAPAGLEQRAAELDPIAPAQWHAWMQLAIRASLGAPAISAWQAFVVEAMIQPFAERAAAGFRTCGVTPRAIPDLSALSDPPDATDQPARPPSQTCPVCGDLPVVGVLREEGHGARRSLVCGLCLTEWEYRRVICPACDEQRFDALPVYTAGSHAHVRIEACDTCHTYMKTIDLTKTGLAVPLVDDLASVTLDLWARERGYQRLRPHLLRT